MTIPKLAALMVFCVPSSLAFQSPAFKERPSSHLFNEFLEEREKRFQEILTQSGKVEDEESGIILGIREGEKLTDPLSGVVGQAINSALRMTMALEIDDDGEFDIDVDTMVPHSDLREIDESVVQSTLAKFGGRILGSTLGKEIFFDPGETTVKEVQYGPDHAVDQFLESSPSRGDAKMIVFNFLGGEMVQLGEIMLAIDKVVKGMDIKPSILSKLNIVGHLSVPPETFAFTVVAMDNPDEEVVQSLSGVERSVARGEFFIRNKKYWTVIDEDIEAKRKWGE